MKYFEYILSVGLKYKQIVDLMVTSWLLSCVCACFHGVTAASQFITSNNVCADSHITKSFKQMNH